MGPPRSFSSPFLQRPPLSLSLSFLSCPLNGPIEDMRRRRRRFTPLNHAVRIDNRAMIADSPSPSRPRLHSARWLLQGSVTPMPSCFLFSPLIRLLISSAQRSPRRAAPRRLLVLEPRNWIWFACQFYDRPELQCMRAPKLELPSCQFLVPIPVDYPRARGTSGIHLEFLNQLLLLHRD